MNMDIFWKQILLELKLGDIIYLVMLKKKNYDQATGSDIKRYEKNKKLITRQGEDYTTGCLLDYDYINNLFKLIAIGLSRQKELDADPKAIQQREFV